MLSEAKTDALFQALAHETRRAMLDIVRSEPGLSVGALATRFDVSRIAIMKHLAVLEAADLIVSQKDGRTRSLYFNIVPLQLIYDSWTDEYTRYWAGHVTGIKNRAEGKARVSTPDEGRKNDKTGS